MPNPKSVREPCEIQPGDTFTLLDLGGVFLLGPRRSETDPIAQEMTAQWAKDGETFKTMLQALPEERERRALRQ